MIDLCKKDAIPVPTFSERTGGFLVTFKFAEPIGRYQEEKITELTARQREILSLIKTFPLTSAQIVEKLKNSVSIRMVQLELKKLEKAGMVMREGESRSTRWIALK
jgi:predicted HTH transcriptional regulator